MSARRPILIFEYLLADADAWAAASPSMQSEAAVMLAAVVQDLQRIEEILPVVLMAPAAATRLGSLGCWDSRTEILPVDRSPADWLRNPTRDPSTFAASLVIAPECDGLLASLLRQLQSDHWSTTCSLNVPWAMAEIFADKLQTCRWLQSHHIRTPDTRTIDQAMAETLLRGATPSPGSSGSRRPQNSDWCIVKPRDGVGSDRVFRVPMNRQPFLQLPMSDEAGHLWIVQPYIPGIACSVGLIGGGSQQTTQILPPGQQQIVQDGLRLEYRGGQIPCADELLSAAMETAQNLTRVLGPFSGYLGADLVVSHDDAGVTQAHVIEINPRLCTSYVGYRAVAEENLARHLLAPSLWETGLNPSHPSQPLSWKKTTVRFDSAGNLSSAESSENR